MKKTVNVVIAGLGGQGVIKASDILSEAAFRSGFEVKKSEIHGMSQRGEKPHHRRLRAIPNPSAWRQGLSGPRWS